ncbi:MAG: diguanylate cyclase [Planctomycetota bacterium]|jgi:diguanylate cyclase (GGDEF)-like protein
MSDSSTPDHEDEDKDLNAEKSGINNLDGESEFDDRFLGLVAEDIERTDHETSLIIKKQSELGTGFYARLIKSLVGLEFCESKSESLWDKLLKHKYDMSNGLGRNVGIKVAAIDYFANITGDLTSVKVIDRDSFLETAEMAISDGLTGLYNHRYFYDRLRRELNDALNEDRPLSIIIIDIDYFKEYNDINGHIAGDVALRNVSEEIKKAEKNGAVCCRYGGEEFTLLLPSTGKAKAGEAAEEIRRSIEERKFPNEFVLPSGKLTVSIGVAEFPLDGTDSRSLVEYADRALYHCKINGKNQVCIFAPNRRKQQRRVATLDAELAVISEDGISSSRDVALVNISTGGLRCRISCRLKINQAVKIYLPESIAGKCEPVIAVVVRCARVEQSVWSLGLRFVRLPDDAEMRIMNFVARGDG